jgi:Na+-translocating ferredoxin:NAD+ oxidoreductase RnfG subunit
VTRAWVVCGVLLALAGGCSGDDDDRGGPAAPERTEPVRSEPERPRRAERLEPARCPPALANCKTADGRIVYVERVDPDGDGDAHFVLSSDEEITLPGVSVIDVKRSLRPRPLPGVGDRISAAGPVYRGSFGQKQIEAIELHVARAR